MKNIAVLGWYSHNNVGDESYKLSLTRFFANKNLHFFNKYTKGNFDLAILGGGNICSDYFLEEIEKFKCKKIAFSIGITSDNNIEKMKIFEKIFVRDEDSQKRLQNHKIESILIPDAAFILDPDKRNGNKILEKYFKENNRDLYENKVAITINNYLCNGNNTLTRDEITFQKFCRDLSKTIDNTNASFVFVPFGQDSPVDDRVPSLWINNLCKYWKKNFVITDTLTPQETLDVIAATNTAISTRLHSSIFATIADIPFIDIIHHDKNRSFVKDIKREEFSFDYWDFERKPFSELLNKILSENHNTKNIHDYLKIKLKTMRNHECFE